MMKMVPAGAGNYTFSAKKMNSIPNRRICFSLYVPNVEQSEAMVPSQYAIVEIIMRTCS